VTVGFEYDVIILSVSESTETTIIGNIVNITVQVGNAGFNDLTSVSARVFYNTTQISTAQTTSLNVGQTKTMTFTWDTAGVAAGSYRIKAVADPVPGEGDTTNNVLLGDVVTLSLGDVTSPAADAGSDRIVNEDWVVVLDGSASSDNVGIATCKWTFTDVTTITLIGQTATYSFSTPGVYPITLRVTDVAGNWDENTVVITVLDVTNPVASAGSDRSVNEDISPTLDGSGSTDNVGVTGYTWTFTDVTLKTLIGGKPSYTFSNPGVYRITLNVTDAAGNWDEDTVVITVNDVTKPEADAGQDQIVNAGTILTLNAGDSTDNVRIVIYEWDFGDQTTGAGKTTTHSYAAPGTYTVKLTVEDAAGNTETDTITVTILSDDPPLWIIGAAVAVIAATAIVIAAVILSRKRK